MENKKILLPSLSLPVRSTNSPTIKFTQDDEPDPPVITKLDLQTVNTSSPNSDRSSGHGEPESPGSKSDRTREGESFDMNKLRLVLPKSSTSPGEQKVSESDSDSSGRQTTMSPFRGGGDEEDKKKLFLNLSSFKTGSPDKHSENVPKLNLGQKHSPSFGSEVDSPQTSMSDRNQTSPTIVGLGKRPPLGLKIPLRDEQIPSPLSSNDSDRQSRSKRKSRKVRVDLLLGDFCTEFETETKPTREELKSCIDMGIFGDESRLSDGMDFEFYTVKPIHEGTNSPNSMEHIACKPLGSDFTVKLLKHLLWENKALKVKLDKSGKAISNLSDEKIQLQQELVKVNSECNSQEMEALKAKVENYEKLRHEVLKQLEYLKTQQEAYEDGNV